MNKKIEVPKKEDLYRYYIVDCLSTNEIAKIYKVSQSMISKWLSHYDIKLSKSDIVKRREATCFKKYGVNNPAKTKQVKDKIKSICLTKYGVESYTQSEDFKDKYKQACLEKYGVDNAAKSDIIKDKIKSVMLEKYGETSYTKTKEYKEKSQNTCLKKYGVPYSYQSEEVKSKIRKTVEDKYGVPYYCMTKDCRESAGAVISKINLKWKDFLGANELEFNIGSFSYDLKLGNTLIEINPTYTHNSTVGTKFHGSLKDPLPKDYHKKKTEEAVNAGYRCVHVFDWDDKDKIKDLVVEPTTTLYARKCVVKEVNKKDVYDFLLKYHIQNNTKSFKVALGLYYNDELVSLMTFGTPRYNKKYQYELLRYCNKSGVKVVGGAEKLFSHFMTIFNPTSIISYCDLSKFTGDVYKKLGFKLDNTSEPTKHWYNGHRHITDNMLRQHGFDRLFGTSFGKGTSNEELMKAAGFVEVYDCGQQTWVMDLEKRS